MQFWRKKNLKIFETFELGNFLTTIASWAIPVIYTMECPLRTYFFNRLMVKHGVNDTLQSTHLKIVAGWLCPPTRNDIFCIMYVYCILSGPTSKKICFQFLSNWKVYDQLTVSLLIINPFPFRCVHDQMKNSHYDHVSFRLKGVRKRFLWMQ